MDIYILAAVLLALAAAFFVVRRLRARNKPDPNPDHLPPCCR